MRLQLQGVRVLVMARVSEIEHMLEEECTIQDCVNWLIRLEEPPSAIKIPSLVSAICKVGDVVFQPAGYLLVDKSCIETNVSV